MSLSLNQKYRPTETDQVCGNKITVSVLNNVIKNKLFSNAILFCGDSGCGKTTLARIFANKINNGVGTPIEIDCASHNSVEDVRFIADAANQRALSGEYKVYILDECHSFTSQAWQAFLKVIEETPKYTVFIFSTTEENKIPETILNRLQKYNISKIPTDEINKRLLEICAAENFTNYSEACDFIAKNSFGCMRDAINKLEYLATYSTDLNLDNVHKVFGESEFETMFDLTCALLNKNEKSVLELITTKSNTGTNLKIFMDSYLTFCLSLLKYYFFKTIDLTNIPHYLEERCAKYASIQEIDVFTKKLIDCILFIKSEIKNDTNYTNTVEANLIRFCRQA